MMMPRMDGYEAARQIRAALGRGVFLVALTGWGQEEDQRRAHAAGALTYVDAVKIEEDLMKLIPKERWFDFTYVIIDHGRGMCVARKPRCEDCFFHQNMLCALEEKTPCPTFRPERTASG